MTDTLPAIEINDLHRSFGRTDAVNGLNLTVQKGRCYGFFGRNGAGKTTTIKCLLNLLQPTQGRIRIFGLDPQTEEVATKSRLTYVPDHVAIYPWMTIAQYFEYLGGFRQQWNLSLQSDLLDRFNLDPEKKTRTLSKGQKVQVALIGALCPEPELLVLDEPTSGLDPLIRREFIQAVIGAYQESDPENRTVLVSTHLITEFEGLIDEFCILDQGKAVYTAETETARHHFSRIRARFPDRIPDLDAEQIIAQNPEGRELVVTTAGSSDATLQQIKAHQPEEVIEESLTLEEIFLFTAKQHSGANLGRL